MNSCLSSLGLLLRDAALCLAPWHEPWRFKPLRDAGRLQLLSAAQSCFLQDASGALCECQGCYMDPLAPARYSLAKGLYMLGRFDAALAALSKLLKLGDGCPFSLVMLMRSGRVLSAQGDLAGLSAALRSLLGWCSQANPMLQQ
ncbi:hypothetical protein OEZ86_013846 [Tetradesmus obliquus]|nr:hypothetical protein OEZ86_013846 [Tetradesmus obliquus]